MGDTECAARPMTSYDLLRKKASVISQRTPHSQSSSSSSSSTTTTAVTAKAGATTAANHAPTRYRSSRSPSRHESVHRTSADIDDPDREIDITSDSDGVEINLTTSKKKKKNSSINNNNNEDDVLVTTTEVCLSAIGHPERQNAAPEVRDLGKRSHSPTGDNEDEEVHVDVGGEHIAVGFRSPRKSITPPSSRPPCTQLPSKPSFMISDILARKPDGENEAVANNNSSSRRHNNRSPEVRTQRHGFPTSGGCDSSPPAPDTATLPSQLHSPAASARPLHLAGRFPGTFFRAPLGLPPGAIQPPHHHLLHQYGPAAGVGAAGGERQRLARMAADAVGEHFRQPAIPPHATPSGHPAGLVQPSVRAGVQHPGVQHPGVQHPGVQHPGARQPGIQYPGLDNANSVALHSSDSDSSDEYGKTSEMFILLFKRE